MFLHFLYQPVKHHELNEEIVCVWWKPKAASEANIALYQEKCDVLQEKKGMKIVEVVLSDDFTYETVKAQLLALE